MPTIHLENCTQCMKCVKDCPSAAIDIKLGTITNTCIHCGHCVAICPVSTITPDVGEIRSLSIPHISSVDFQNFQAGLRSIRYYLKKEVSDETIQLLTDNMRHYASASNARPIIITVVKSPEKIQYLNDLSGDTIIKVLRWVLSPVLKPFVRIFAPSINTRRLKVYKDSFLRKRLTNSSMICHHAPLVMLFHAPKTKYGMADSDAMIWATNTTLYAKSLGLGSCFIGFIVKAMEKNKSMKSEMHIPVNHKVYAALTLGYPKVNYQNETSRKKPKVNFV